MGCCTELVIECPDMLTRQKNAINRMAHHNTALVLVVIFSGKIWPYITLLTIFSAFALLTCSFSDVCSISVLLYSQYQNQPALASYLLDIHVFQQSFSS